MKQNTIDEICDSITRLGKICSAQDKAQKMVSGILADVKMVTSKVKGLDKPKYFSVYQGAFRKTDQHFLRCGQQQFLRRDDRAWRRRERGNREKISYPQVSLEGLMTINPNVIIDLVGDKTFYHSKTK